MSETFTYKSDRGMALLYVGEPLDLPVITLENYIKWYNIFMVMPDGTVQTVPIEMVQKALDESRTALQIDHNFHPELLDRLGELLNAEVDERATEVATGRWVLEYNHISYRGML